MKTLPVGELKTHFSEVLEDVKHGEEFVVCFGRKKEKIAVIIPYSHYKRPEKRKLGVWDGQVGYLIHDDFKITEEEFFNL